MNARLAGAALWAAVSCLPQSDDLGAYSAEWSPGAADGAGNGGVAGAFSAAGAAGAGSGNAGSDGVVGGGSIPLDGTGGSRASGGSGGTVRMAGSAAGGSGAPDETCADGILSADATRCYIVSSEGAAWIDAVDECAALQASLVKVETAEEDALLDGLLSVNQWLGASDTATENVFVWSDGSPIEFGNWGPDQPDRFPGPDCVEKRNTTGREWFDQPCDNLRAFVCDRAVSAGRP